MFYENTLNWLRGNNPLLLREMLRQRDDVGILSKESLLTIKKNNPELAEELLRKRVSPPLPSPQPPKQRVINVDARRVYIYTSYDDNIVDGEYEETNYHG